MPAVGELKRLNDLLQLTVVKAVSRTNIFVVGLSKADLTN